MLGLACFNGCARGGRVGVWCGATLRQRSCFFCVFYGAAVWSLVVSFIAWMCSVVLISIVFAAILSRLLHERVIR